MMRTQNEPGIVSGYLAPRQAAEYLSISVKKLEHLRRRGGGPRFCKIGRLCRYPVAELDQWMRARLVGATCEGPAK